MTRPDRYDPDINQTFHEFAQHYGVVIIPAPPRKPKGKAKVEVSGSQSSSRQLLLASRGPSSDALAHSGRRCEVTIH